VNVGNPSARIQYLDVLKVILILCVLFQHLPEYLGYNPLTFLNMRVFTEQLGGIGVSGFVILSGIGLGYAHLHRHHKFSIGKFWRQRMLRITPLYYLALAAWLFAVALIPPMNLLAHMLFIHVFFRDYSHNPGSLWYVGLIVQCYLIFPLALQMLKRSRLEFLWLATLLFYALGIWLISVGFYLSDTVLMYGPEFVLGMDFALRMKNRNSNPYTSRVGWLIGAIALVTFVVAYQTPQWWGLSPAITWPLTTSGRIGFFLVILNIVSRVKTSRFEVAIVPLAYASYAVFLFHRPMWTAAILSPLWGWFGRLPDVLAGAVQFSYLVLLGIPLIFVISYWMQSSYDHTLTALSERL